MKKAKKGLSTFLIIVVLLGGAGLGAYLALRRAETERHPRVPTQPRIEVPAPHAKVKVYRVSVEKNRPVIRPTECAVAPGRNPAEAALQQLIEQGDTADLTNPIPVGTRLLGFNVKNGLATVNLSREFKNNFAGGSEAEALTIGVILRTLGQFKEIKKVQLLVEGETIETLGHSDLSQPLDVSWVSPEYGGGD